MSPDLGGIWLEEGKMMVWRQEMGQINMAWSGVKILDGRPRPPLVSGQWRLSTSCTTWNTDSPHSLHRTLSLRSTNHFHLLPFFFKQTSSQVWKIWVIILKGGFAFENSYHYLNQKILVRNGFEINNIQLKSDLLKFKQRLIYMLKPSGSCREVEFVVSIIPAGEWDVGRIKWYSMRHLLIKPDTSSHPPASTSSSRRGKKLGDIVFIKIVLIIKEDRL